MQTNWQTKKLEDICEDLFAGGDVPKDNFSKVKTEKFNIPIFSNGEKNKGLYGYTNTGRVIKPSITISARGTIGYSEIRNSPFYPAVRLIVLLPDNKEIDIKFLKYVIESIDFSRSGTSIPQLTVPMVSDKEICYPPLPEQKRIVKILDGVFAKIDQAKANTEKNLANSQELFDSYLNDIFANPGKDWEERQLKDVYDVRDGTHDSPKYQESGYPLITSKNLKEGKLNFDKVKYISTSDYKAINKRSKVNKGDVLFAMIGTIGNPVVVDVEPKFSIKNVALFKNNTEQNTYFLKYYLSSKMVIDKMLREAKGTTQKFVGLGYLRNFPVFIPLLTTQKTIVAKLDKLSAQTQKLTQIYQQKIDNLGELKKSILQQAFGGKL